MLGQLAHKVWRKARRLLEPRPDTLFPLRAPLQLPAGVAEADFHAFVASVRPAGAPEAEMVCYAAHDCRRFLHTLGLVRDLDGPALELGANPYFTTMLLRRFSRLELTLANYCGDQPGTAGLQQVFFRAPGAEHAEAVELPFHHFNAEKERFPFADADFAVVLFCEILEHLQQDPLAALREIRRVLRPDGVLILTTPNVRRLENLARMLAGENIYDPYSGYGPYGRHNREYTWRELELLLEHAGFGIETIFSADVHANQAGRFFPLSRLSRLVPCRARDLGQYLFVRARKRGAARPGVPAWLYRSVSEPAAV